MSHLNHKDFEYMLTKINPILSNFIEQSKNSNTKLCNIQTFEELNDKTFDISSKFESKDDFLNEIVKVLDHSLKTSHPQWYKQLYGGSEPIGILSELVAAVINSTCHIFPVAPVYVVMEEQIVKTVAKLIGWDTEKTEGIFVPGGTMAEITALTTAKHWKFPHVRENGWNPDDKPIIFTSAQCH